MSNRNLRRTATVACWLAIALGHAGCDALIGLGEEPVEAASSATSATSTGAAPGATASVSAGEGSTGVQSSSSQSGGGAGGDGGNGAGGSGAGGDAISASSTGGGGDGGGETGPPCGTCAPEDDQACGGPPGQCVDGICRVRKIALEIPLPLSVAGSRGFAVRGDEATFINVKAPTEADLTVASLATGAVGSVPVSSGGVIASTGIETVFMTFGASPNTFSTLTSVGCTPAVPGDTVLTCEKNNLDIATGFYGAMGADPKLHPGEIYVSQNNDYGILRLPVSTSSDPCLVATWHDSVASHIFFPTPSGPIGWSMYGDEDDVGGFQIATEDTCAGNDSVLSAHQRLSITYGIAQAGDNIVFIAYDTTYGVTAYHATPGTIDAEPIQVSDGKDGTQVLPAFESPTVAFRRSNLTFLVPRAPTGMWECDDSATTCEPFELPNSVVLDGKVFAVYSDDDRTVILQHGVAPRLLCIDET